MTKEKRLEELSEIAITTITEFFEEMEFIGWEPIQEISYNKIEKTIYIEHMEDEEYRLEDIENLLKKEIEGFGPFGSNFYEGIGLAEDELESDYGEVPEAKKVDYKYIVEQQENQEQRKKEFIENAGRLMYVKYRGPEVLNILKAIGKEAKGLITR